MHVPDAVREGKGHPVRALPHGQARGSPRALSRWASFSIWEGRADKLAVVTWPLSSESYAWKSFRDALLTGADLHKSQRLPELAQGQPHAAVIVQEADEDGGVISSTAARP